MNLYRRKQNPIDVFIADVLTVSEPSYKTGKELSIITAYLNEVRTTGWRKAPWKPIALGVGGWWVLSAGPEVRFRGRNCAVQSCGSDL